MSLKKIITLISISILSCILVIGIVFGAYTFTKNILISNDVGQITINSKEFYKYNKEHSLTTSDANYKKAEKLRTDTVLTVDGIVLSYTSSYSLTQDTVFKDGKTYYTKKEDNNYYAENVTVGASVTAGTYYEETKTYTGINSIATVYNSAFETLTPAISGSTITITVGTVTCTLVCTLNSDGYISSITSTFTNDADYRTVLDPDGLGFIILDNEKTSDSNYYSTQNANTAITCAASSDKHNSSNIYLSQLGLHFEFEADIAVYIRIHIQDAWIRTRQYSSGPRINYILKDQVNGNSPFTVSDEDWYYDARTNYVYLKEMFVPDELNSGEGSYTFLVNEAYFYNTLSTAAYTEYADVEVSFTVDIVQANRARILWGIDPSTVGV